MDRGCEEKDATTHYGKLYHFCEDCNDAYLEEVAKDLGLLEDDNQEIQRMESTAH